MQNVVALSDESGAAARPRRSERLGIASLVAAVALVISEVAVGAAIAAAPEFAYRADLAAGTVRLSLLAPVVLLAILSLMLGIAGLVRSRGSDRASLAGTAVGVSALVPSVVLVAISAAVSAG